MFVELPEHVVVDFAGRRGVPEMADPNESAGIGVRVQIIIGTGGVEEIERERVHIDAEVIVVVQLDGGRHPGTGRDTTAATATEMESGQAPELHQVRRKPRLGDLLDQEAR